MTSKELPQQRLIDRLPAALASLVAASHGDVAGALVPWLHNLWADLQNQRAKEFAEQLVEDLDEEAAVRIATAIEREPELFVDAFRAAIATDLERKRRALARVLRESTFHEMEESDEERLLLRAIEPLEVQHLEILDILRHPEDQDGSPIGAGTSLGYDLIKPRYNYSLIYLPTFISQLEGWGLIVDTQPASTNAPDNARFRVTSFGERLYRFLEEATDESAAT